MKTEMATTASIKAVEGFDKDNLNKAETVEKNSLPDQDGMLVSNFEIILETVKLVPCLFKNNYQVIQMKTYFILRPVHNKMQVNH